ncbi:MAG: hypothetical protein M1814_000419 [Vezdaea aestivalis]|nr:MAG: hypothetical protein M1814_000419 [Vezdaea aestivalis]
MAQTSQIVILPDRINQVSQSQLWDAEAQYFEHEKRWTEFAKFIAQYAPHNLKRLLQRDLCDRDVVAYLRSKFIRKISTLSPALSYQSKDSKSQRVMVLQSVPPEVVGIECPCAYPFCPRGYTTPGMFRLSLEPCENLELSRVPVLSSSTASTTPNAKRGRGRNGQVWYCLECVESIYNGSYATHPPDWKAALDEELSRFFEATDRQVISLRTQENSNANFAVNQRTSDEFPMSQKSSSKSTQRPLILKLVRNNYDCKQDWLVMYSRTIKERYPTPPNPKVAGQGGLHQISSMIYPETRYHDSEFFTLSFPQQHAIWMWKNTIMRQNMFTDPKNFGTLRSECLIPKHSMPDTGGSDSIRGSENDIEPVSVVDEPPVRGFMNYGGYCCELTAEEVRNQELSDVLKESDERCRTIIADLGEERDFELFVPKPKVWKWVSLNIKQEERECVQPKKVKDSDETNSSDEGWVSSSSSWD